MNLVVLVGNLTRDPEVRYTQSGMAVANINIAVNRVSPKDGGPDSDFFRVTVFGKQAENVERYLSKGKKVGVEGRIQNDNYEKDGQKIYRDTIIANRVEFLSPRGSGEGGSRSVPDWSDPFDPAPAGSRQPAPEASAPQAAPASAAQQPPTGFSALEDDEDDLPF
ncbi:MAG: single-stranded DNA-binding protein [Clostridiales Family XIII bacterium]|jgi:single-strand DNA-binding protein|nr:single-stranded DNA-binding protein [Clostridiales Family XIII bacterium]